MTSNRWHSLWTALSDLGCVPSSDCFHKSFCDWFNQWLIRIHTNPIYGRNFFYRGQKTGAGNLFKTRDKPSDWSPVTCDAALNWCVSSLWCLRRAPPGRMSCARKAFMVIMLIRSYKNDMSHWASVPDEQRWLLFFIMRSKWPQGIPTTHFCS